MPLFQFEPYDNTRNIGELLRAMGRPAQARADALRRTGDVQAQAALQRGQIMGQTIGNLGTLASGAIQQYGEQRQAQQQEQALREIVPAFLGGQIGPEAVLNKLGPDLGGKVISGAKAWQELESGRAADAQKSASQLAIAADAMPDDLLDQVWEPLRTTSAKAFGLQPDAIPAQPDRKFLRGTIQALSGQQPKAPEFGTRNPTDDIFDKATGQVVTPGTPAAPKPATPPPVGSFEDYVVSKYGERPTPDQIVEARKTYQQADDRPRVDVRVAGGQGNTGALSSEGVEYAATAYRVTGVMPPMGMGNSQARAAIINEAAKQAKALGQSPAAAIQKQYALKADSSALNRMTVMKSSAQSFEQKALAQAGKVVELSRTVGRSKWPIINRAIVAGKTEIAGDPNATLLLNAVLTFTAEYAKIIEGSTGSAQGSSDAARRATEKLLNPSFSHAQVAKAVDLMRWEMAQTITGYDFVIGQITDRMGGGPQTQPPTDPLGLRK